MADLAVKLQAIDPALREALSVLFLVVFGIKAAIFRCSSGCRTRIRRLPPPSPPYSPAC